MITVCYVALSSLLCHTWLSHMCCFTADENGSTLRTLYYPPVDSDLVKEGQLRCGEHSDYGSITLVFQSPEGGLQVI